MGGHHFANSFTERGQAAALALGLGVAISNVLVVSIRQAVTPDRLLAPLWVIRSPIPRMRRLPARPEDEPAVALA